MKIKIVSVGKIKEQFLVDGINEYAKRIGKYSKLEMIEVADEKAPESLSEKEKDIIKDKEAEKILSKIDNEYIIVLSIDGMKYDSMQFAGLIQNLFSYESSNICFIIGGSLGIGKKVYDKANMYLSFSSMTFPHQLMKMILLEQIYRAFKINNNEPYHK